jgi:hypothetical protein
MCVNDRTTFLAGKESITPTNSFSLPASSSGPPRSYFPCRQGEHDQAGHELLAGKELPSSGGQDFLAGKQNGSPGDLPLLAGKQNGSPGDLRSLPASRMGP